jgi:hypothetical protein
MILKRQSKPLLRRILRSLRWAKEDQNSNRETSGNRNRHISCSINDLNFSNREEMRGVSGLSASNIQRPTSNLCKILIATRASRNHLNSPSINETRRSNRNKMKGSRGPGKGRTGEMKGSRGPGEGRTGEMKGGPTCHHRNLEFLIGSAFRLEMRLTPLASMKTSFLIGAD